MFKITMTGTNLQELEQSFVANLDTMRRYAYRCFRSLPDEQDRLVVDAIESFWFAATRKLERGEPLELFPGWICQGVISGFFNGDTGTVTNPSGLRRVLRGHNDSRTLNNLVAKMDALNLKLDIRLAVQQMTRTHRRVILLTLEGLGYTEIRKRLHIRHRTIAKARAALRELLADYAS